MLNRFNIFHGDFHDLIWFSLADNFFLFFFFFCSSEQLKFTRISDGYLRLHSVRPQASLHVWMNVYVELLDYAILFPLMVSMCLYYYFFS